MFGYSAHELLGQALSQLIQRETNDSKLRSCFDAELGSSCLLRGIRKDGTFFPCELAGSEMELAGRRLFIGAVQDVSERQVAGARLHAHIHYLESMQRVSDALAQSVQPDELLNNVVTTIRSIFQVDRAWLVYPCDPDSISICSNRLRQRPSNWSWIVRPRSFPHPMQVWTR
jgi:hypothetical protein